jgi:hypothetical protein
LPAERPLCAPPAPSRSRRGAGVVASLQGGSRAPAASRYMSAESIANALADPVDEAEEVMAIEAAA